MLKILMSEGNRRSRQDNGEHFLWFVSLLRNKEMNTLTPGSGERKIFLFSRFAKGTRRKRRNKIC